MDHGPVTQQSAERSTPATAIAERTGASHRGERGARLRIPASWPLLAVLAVQAVLSLLLVRADTAFEDEATYLWAGHLEWAHLLHGAPLPQFPSYFSGAPVIYPPIGALADSVGGLTAARILSLAFMLGATVALWATADRLFGRGPRSSPPRCSPSAARRCIWERSPPTTPCRCSWSRWRPGSLSAPGERRDATVWMIAAGVALALADATAYTYALFDLVVLLLALVTALPEARRQVRRHAPPDHSGRRGGARHWRHCCSAEAATTTGSGRQRYSGPPARTPRSPSWPIPGRGPASSSSRPSAASSISWVRRPGRAQTWLLTLLAGAALLVPAEQASLHTTASLNKHVDLGIWFAAIAAGYAVDRLIAAAPAGNMRAVTCGACVIALCFPVVLGASQSRTFSTSWPNSTAFIAILGPLVDHSTGRLLVEDPSLAEYYLPAGSQWMRWSSTRNIVLPSGAPTGGPSDAAGVVGAGNAGTFALYIQEGYFSLVALNFADTTSLDHSLAADLHRNHHYHVIEVVPYGAGPAGPAPGEYVIWRYEPQP